jgi:hypothetical protein
MLELTNQLLSAISNLSPLPLFRTPLFFLNPAELLFILLPCNPRADQVSNNRTTSTKLQTNHLLGNLSAYYLLFSFIF